MANFNLNKVILGGRLTADPELKQTPNGIPVVSFSIAVNRRFQSKENAQQQTDFFNVTAWRATAEFVSRYFRKGSSICVIGSIQNRSWTDQQGNKGMQPTLWLTRSTSLMPRARDLQTAQGDICPPPTAKCRTQHPPDRLRHHRADPHRSLKHSTVTMSFRSK